MLSKGTRFTPHLSLSTSVFAASSRAQMAPVRNVSHYNHQTHLLHDVRNAAVLCDTRDMGDGCF